MIEKNSNDDYLERKMIELETKVAYQEDTVEVLNGIVSEQQQDILKLRSQMQLLLDELKGVLSELDDGRGSVSSQASQRPPHY